MINEQINVLNKIYSMSQDTHNILTPISLCDEMINSLNIKDNKSILVVSNMEFLISLRKHNIDMKNVHYTVSCPIKKQFAEKIGVSLNNIHNLEYNNKEINFGTQDMKFDYIVMNPPYGKLHIPFLKYATDLRNEKGEIISIQPIDKFQINTYKENLEWLKPSNIKIIPSIEANKKFTAVFNCDLGIIHINGEHNFDINQLKYFNNYFNNINNKRTKSLHEHYIYSKNNVTDYFVEFNIIHGHFRGLDEYELFSATKMEINKECGGRPNDKRRLYFNTELEANNFIKSCRCITYYLIRRFGNATSTTIPMSFMPFMEDYSKVWTDKDYCDYFNINYDDVLKEMSKYIPQVKKSYPEYEPNI